MATLWCLTESRYQDQRMPSAVVDWLAGHGHDVRVVVADRETVRIDGRRVSSPWQGLSNADVVVSRTRHPLGLALLDAAARSGAELVTPWAGVEAVRNKARCADVLALHALPTPETFLAASPAALLEIDPGSYPLVLKPHLGDNSVGVTLVRTARDLERAAWDDGLVLAQRWVDTGGWDVKLYVCGEQVWAVRRPSPLDACAGRADTAEPVPVTPELRWIARTCSNAFGLPLCGVDLVLSERGPLVVDVNDFPNYTGVTDAPEAIGTLLTGRLDTRRLLTGVRSCAS